MEQETRGVDIFTDRFSSVRGDQVLDRTDHASISWNDGEEEGEQRVVLLDRGSLRKCLRSRTLLLAVRQNGLSSPHTFFEW